MLFKRVITGPVILIMVLSCAMVFAQTKQIGTLLNLTISGNKTAEAGVIKLSSSLKEGTEVTDDDLQHAVKQLWALGIFSDIRILLDHRTPDGVFLTIRVEEYPRLEKTVVDGNHKMKTDEVEKEIGFFRGQVINPSQIAKAQKQILKAYGGKGYTLAKADFKTEKADRDDRIVLKIHIEEGRRVQIKKIQFHGNGHFSNKTLRKQMKDTKENRLWGGGDFDTQKFTDDKDKVLAFYRKHGHLDAEMENDSLYYDVEKKDMFIDLWVKEGPCYYLGKVTWEGNKLFPNQALEALLQMQTGDVFNQEKFEQALQEKIGGAYYDLGYIYAGITPQETIRGGDTVDVRFMINENNPVKIRKILITGNTRTKDRVIRRELRVKPGDVFSKDMLMRSHRELMMLNYFANVTPDVVPVDDSNLDVSFKLEEKSTDTANLSAGYSELDKLIGNVGLGMNNLFGNGQRLNLDWNFGRYYRSFNLGFTEPWFHSTPTVIGANIYQIKRDPYYIGYSQQSLGATLSFGKRFTWPDNYFRGDWSYRIDKTSLGDFSGEIILINPNNIVNEPWPQVSSGVTQVISRNSLDQPEFPTRGSLFSLTTEFAGGPFGGNVGFHKHVFSAEYFVPTFIPKLILLSRVQTGFMNFLTKKDSLISYLDYFFMGGSGMSQATPLRGYDDPLVNGSYYNEGGKTMFKTTMELRFPILPNPTMYGLLFAEAGNTWSDLRHTDPFDLRRSAGIGARIYMPMVGMLGFDYAYGFDHYKDGNRYGVWKPHFVFGRSF
jgi:outer membrane protein insertion porin family